MIRLNRVNLCLWRSINENTFNEADDGKPIEEKLFFRINGYNDGRYMLKNNQETEMKLNSGKGRSIIELYMDILTD